MILDKFSKKHLAQINIGKMRGDNINDVVMETFVAQLDEINALADNSKGFVWRLKSEGNNATSIDPFGDKRIIVNMSVWETAEDLKDFVYNSRHKEVLKAKRNWFEKLEQMFMVLWFIPVGHTPTIEEAKHRLEYLQKNGATAYAFDFKFLINQ